MAADIFTFSVSDSGVGISAADRAKLFRPFQQAVDGRPPEPGTGLGLAISQRLVELMGGRLEVESEPGRGSTFSFAVRLPVLAADAAADRTSTGTITGYTGPRRRVLIVDDVATNRHVLTDLLAPLGFEVAEAASGDEALAIAPALRPDLVLLDLRMPGMDGLELAQRLRSAGRQSGAGLPTRGDPNTGRETRATPEAAGARPPKLIAMSASVLSFSREKAFEAGCDDFLPKPFREADLLAKIRLHLGVAWIYESAALAPAAATGKRGLDAFALQTLLDAARRGQVVELRRQFAALRPAAPALVADLEALLAAYRMENLRERIERELAAMK